jgi:hypothetical protein
MVLSRLSLGGGIGSAQGIRTRPHDVIRQGDAKAAFQLLSYSLKPIKRVSDVAQVLLDDGEADFPLAADIPATRTARSGGYLGAINGNKAEVR